MFLLLTIAKQCSITNENSKSHILKGRCKTVKYLISDENVKKSMKIATATFKNKDIKL